MSFELKSPFEYTTPEAIPAKDIIDLFVPVFGEYFNVPSAGHTFINGPRGCGKSMMFRYMEPDCQSIVEKKKVSELSYFAIHIPIKEGQLDKTDLSLLADKHGETLLNEHFMVVNFAIKIFEKLGDATFDDSGINVNALKKYYNESFIKHLNYARWNRTVSLPAKSNSYQSIFLQMKEICSEINREFTQNYIFKLVGMDGPLPYNGPICLFADFLLPILKEIKELPLMPNSPIYLLIDDADNLTLTQTKILNTWVSLRTSDVVSFKISTQLNYKTYRTINNSRIDTPHDYSEINISDIYTTTKGLYKKRVKDAVEKRLRKFGLNVGAEAFLPEDKEQEKKIKAIFEEYKAKEGYDYAYRYARPDFMKSIIGNLNTFSYAGFDSLVHISSGIMRHFIDFANRMYTYQMADPREMDLKYIEPGIQDRVIKEYSNWFFDENFSKLRDDAENTNEDINDFDKLRNLIQALGETFHLILFSSATERRVFSFALQDDPDAELRKILNLGVQNGYFQKSLIGNKMGTGKARLYILNRLLAPHFKLDPTSFAGYKFVTCDVLKEAICKPKTVIGRIQRKGIDSVFENPQQSLFKDRVL
jgi:hypothetical protein